MTKKFLFFLFMFYLYGIFNYVSSDIIPLKKPILSKEQTQKKLLIDALRPLPKPIEENKEKKTEKKIIVKKNEKSGIILPKKNL